MPQINIRLFRWCQNPDGTVFCSRATAERAIRDGLIEATQVGGATFVHTTHAEYIARRLAQKKPPNLGQVQHRRAEMDAAAAAARQRRAAARQAEVG